MKTCKEIIKMLDEYKFHPLCIFFPIPPERELLSMAVRMKMSGQYYPILRLKSTQEIIDGRIRLILCLMAEMTPLFLDLDIIDDESIADVVSRCNIDRRHMELGTKLTVGLKMEEWLRKRSGIAIQEDNGLRKIQEMAQTKKTAKKIHTTAKTLNQFRQLKVEAESNPDVRKALNQLENGRKENSINRLYIKHLVIHSKKRVVKPNIKTKIELRQEIIDLKEELKSVKLTKVHYERLYKEVKEIAVSMNIWDNISEQLTYIIENVVYKDEESSFPTIKQLREAGLL